jgi:hypothetical protein
MHIKINDIRIDGFAISSAKSGEKVKVQIKGIETSESNMFFVFSEQISKIVFPKTGILNLYDDINRYLIIIHPDHTADFYGQDLKVQATVKPTRDIKAGEVLFTKDISEISNVAFPDIKINPDDQIIYLTRKGWRFGIYFNLTRKISTDKIGEDIAELHTKLIFEDLLKKILNELIQKELTQKNTPSAFVITEGKTDILHLKRAFSENKYSKHIEYSESYEDLGDTGLIEICHRASHLPHYTSPVICIFDRDNPQIMNKLLKGDISSAKSFQSWGNNVYSLILPVPENRKGYQNISIEMYYSDNVIMQKTPHGKRLYFDNEIKKEILPGDKPIYRPIEPIRKTELSKKIFDSDVDNIINDKGIKLGISKSVFAEMVFNKKEPFNKDIDFSNFSLISDVIDQIIEDSKSKKTTNKSHS